MKQYSIAYLKFYWKKAIPLIILSFLSTVLLCSSVIAKTSYDNKQLSLFISINGNWDVRYMTTATDADLQLKELINKNIEISHYEDSSAYRYNNLPHYPLLFVSNFNSLKNQTIEGRLPVNSTEILFDKQLDKNVKLNSTIRLYNNKKFKDFKIVGIYQGFGKAQIYTLQKNLDQGIAYGFIKNPKVLETRNELIQINQKVTEIKYKTREFDHTFHLFFILIAFLILFFSICTIKLYCQDKILALFQLEQLGCTRKQTKKILKFEIHLLTTTWIILGTFISFLVSSILLKDLFYISSKTTIFLLSILILLDICIQIASLYFLYRPSSLLLKKYKIPTLKSKIVWLSIIQFNRLPFTKTLILIFISLFLISGITTHYTESWIQNTESLYFTNNDLSIYFNINTNPLDFINKIENILGKSKFESIYKISTTYDSTPVYYKKNSNGNLNETVILYNNGIESKPINITNGIKKDGAIYVSNDFINTNSVFIEGTITVRKCPDVSTCYNNLKNINLEWPEYINVINDYTNRREFEKQRLLFKSIIYGYIVLLLLIGYFIIYAITLQLIKNNEDNIHLLHVLGFTKNMIKQIYFHQSLMIVISSILISTIILALFNIFQTSHLFLWMSLSVVFVLLFQWNLAKIYKPKLSKSTFDL